jgi:Spy/CpxP family protein refolding chaperone
MMTMLSKWKLVLYLAAIFATGGVSGWVVATKTARDKVFAPPRKDEVAERLRACLHARLNLADDQKTKVDAIIERSSKEIWSLRGEHMARLRQAVTSRNKELMAVLGTEQRQQFEQIEKERDEAWRSREGSRGTNSSWRGGAHGPRREKSDRERDRDRSGHSTNNTSVTNGSADGLEPRQP